MKSNSLKRSDAVEHQNDDVFGFRSTSGGFSGLCSHRSSFEFDPDRAMHEPIEQRVGDRPGVTLLSIPSSGE
ncbi:MAG: hypothetical protein U1E22_09755 [Coriobacteriia bacterium]|nr:hypothetical protein [Coriobacteriia bacterium]